MDLPVEVTLLKFQENATPLHQLFNWRFAMESHQIAATEHRDVGLQEGFDDDEHHQENKSVLKKVKAKAKKIKNVLKRGHGHDTDNEQQHIPDDHDLDEEEDEDEDTPEESAIHGRQGLSGDTAVFGGERTREPRFTQGGEVQDVGLKGVMELEEDPHAPRTGNSSDPGNYQSKVTDPTRSGGEEADVTPILSSLDKTSSHGEQTPPVSTSSPPVPSGSHDQFSSELTPPTQLHTAEEKGHKPESPSSYKEKLSSATTSLVDTAISAKNSVTARLGYGNTGNQTGERGGDEERRGSRTGNPLEYGKKLATNMSERLSPVYGKLAGASSAVASKFHGTGTPGNEAEATGTDRGMSVKDYLADKLKPGEEDRVLSEVISEVLHVGGRGEQKTEKPIGKVTESEEVRRHLAGAAEKPGGVLGSGSLESSNNTRDVGEEHLPTYTDAGRQEEETIGRRLQEN